MPLNKLIVVQIMKRLVDDITFSITVSRLTTSGQSELSVGVDYYQTATDQSLNKSDTNYILSLQMM